MRTMTLLLIGIVAVHGHAATAQSSDFERRRAEMQADFERRRQEMQKDFERRSELRKQGHSNVSQARQTPRSGRMYGTSFNPVPFDAASAPAPDLCFLKFVETAKSASSMDALLPFLKTAEVRTLKECQQNYDPKLAAQRKSEYARDPSMSASSIEHLTQDPYSNKFKFLKDIATKVTRVRKSEIKGNKAILEVATRANAKARFNKGDWESFPYGRAKVEMLGEGNYWRFDSYNDSDVFYKAPQ